MIIPYATIEEAVEYFENRLHSDAWDHSEEINQNKALRESTLIIDRLNYQGRKNSKDQEKQFPRYPDTEIPSEIKYATCEIALALLDGVDPDMEYENLFMTSQQYANVRSTYDRKRISRNIPAGVPSIRAWRFLQPYLRDPETVNLNRIG